MQHTKPKRPDHLTPEQRREAAKRQRQKRTDAYWDRMAREGGWSDLVDAPHWRQQRAHQANQRGHD